MVSSSKDGTVKFWDTLSGMYYQYVLQQSCCNDISIPLCLFSLYVVSSLGLCVRTIAPTLLARSSSGSVGNSQSYSKMSYMAPESQSLSSSLSPSSASYFLSSSSTSSTLSSTWDQSGGEVRTEQSQLIRGTHVFILEHTVLTSLDDFTSPSSFLSRSFCLFLFLYHTYFSLIFFRSCQQCFPMMAIICLYHPDSLLLVC